MSRKPIQSRPHRIPKSQDDLVTVQHGELYSMGKFWLTTVKTGLFGPISIIPTVYAAAKEEVPKKPPPMKYEDLPLYECPHSEYKEYLNDQEKCPGYKCKIFHESLYPRVKSARESWCKSLCELKRDLGELGGELCTAIQTRKNDFVKYMRSPENLVLRQVTVALGGLTGYYLGSGRFLVARRIVGTGIGLLATGALCFPQETDDAFREFSFHSTKFILGLYNRFCNKNLGLREKLPCKSELPEPLVVQRKPNDCPHNKKEK